MPKGVSDKGITARFKWFLALTGGGWKCHYCGCLLPPNKRSHTTGELSWWPEVDHVVPRAKGGSDLLRNLVLACPPCNQRKQAKDYLSFVESH